MASTSVTFDIVGRDRSGSDAFNRVANSANRADGAMSKFRAGAMKVAKAGVFALGAGAVVAAKGLYEMGQAAVEDEAAASKLAQTLKSTVGATDSQIAAVERWITAQGKAFGVADDDLRPALQRLTEATGDVAESQRLASLAMDVSAGTGKSLKTVSEALMKAQNGQISGLSRLGIETKDAKGETLSFREATAKMAETFKGQAEKNAETLSGKMARLKVTLSEAGEEIGAKLLPYVSDAADVFMNKGVPAIEAFGDKAGPVFADIVDGAKDIKDAVQPAVEEIAEALGHLATEGKGAGGIFDDVLLPALRGTSDVIAGLVNFIDELPGPVKDLGVQGAFAAYGLFKLQGAMVAVRDSGFAATMTDSAKRTDALRGAAKNAAGIGGILALTQGFQGAKDEGVSFGDTMGLVAGGAGIGLMFGPIGALVGAAGGGGLAALMHAFGETEEEARRARLELKRTEGLEDAKDGAKRLADALNGVVNAYGDVSRAAVEASFVGDDGKLDSDIQLLRDLGVSMDTIVAATLGQKDAQKVASSALDEYVGDLRMSASEQQAIVDDLKSQIEDYYAVHSGQNADSAMTPELEALQTQLEAYQGNLDTLNGALDDATVGQDNFTAKVNENTDALQFHKEKLKELRSDLSVTLERYKKWPATVRTEFEANGLPETSAGALRLIGQFKDLQDFKDIKTLVKLDGVTLSTRQILDLQKKYGLTDEEVETLARLEGVPASIAEADRLETRLNNIQDEEVHIYTVRHDNGANGSGLGPVDSDGTPRRPIVKRPILPPPPPPPSGELSRAYAAATRGGTGSVATATYGGGGDRRVIEIRVVGSELDLTKAKQQINAVAREVARDEIRDDREWLRTQE